MVGFRWIREWVTYDAYHMVETFLTQPLQIVVRAEAVSKWMSDERYRRAASANKQRTVIACANHMMRCDGERECAEAMAALGPFF